MTLLNAKDLKQQASIVALLERLGYQPVKKSGKEYIYRSMLRDGDSTPSFTVDDKIGAWYDHGTGKGGNIVDFGLAYWKYLSFSEVIEKLQEAVILLPVVRETSKRKINTPPHYVIEAVKPIGTHPAITEYLKSRSVFETAPKYMNEIYYRIGDDKGEEKRFFAAGWKNENGSWEVRNRFFKGCLGHKGMTFLSGDPKRLAIFEGYINFLSWRLVNPEAGQSVLVMNSLSLLALAIERAKAYTFIDLYMDRDPPGHIASKDFIKILPYASDRSISYDGYNDYNDKLVSMLSLHAKDLKNTVRKR